MSNRSLPFTHPGEAIDVPTLGSALFLGDLFAFELLDPDVGPSPPRGPDSRWLSDVARAGHLTGVASRG